MNGDDGIIAMEITLDDGTVNNWYGVWTRQAVQICKAIERNLCVNLVDGNLVSSTSSAILNGSCSFLNFD